MDRAGVIAYNRLMSSPVAVGSRFFGEDDALVQKQLLFCHADVIQRVHKVQVKVLCLPFAARASGVVSVGSFRSETFNCRSSQHVRI